MSYLNQFHHRLAGTKSGPKLVFLHGLMGYAANWRRITPSFEADFEILTFDQRGHGRSIKPDHGYRPEDYANDLRQILSELNWKKIHLVGHSMGGRNALVFTDLFPEAVEKLVIEDIGPDLNLEGAKRIQQILEMTPTPFSDKRAAKEFFLNHFKNPTLGAYLYSNIEEHEGGWDWRFSRSAIIESLEAGRSQERWSEIEKLKVPTLWIRGEKSEELLPEIFEQILKRNSRIQGKIIEGAGHWVHSDQPDKFISALKNFF